ncbi:GtrA family protein [Cupriavidus basilensis]
MSAAVSAGEFRQVARFLVAGASSTGVHVAVAATLISVMGTSPVTANGVAFLCATACSYLLNTLWSFSSRLRHRTLGRFAAVSLLGLGFDHGHFVDSHSRWGPAIGQALPAWYLRYPPSPTWHIEAGPIGNSLCLGKADELPPLRSHHHRPLPACPRASRITRRPEASFRSSPSS